MTAPHRPHAHGETPVRALGFGLLTISDTRTDADDLSGRAMRELVASAGHAVREAAIVRDEPALVRERVLAWASEAACDAIVCSGGTGLAGRDRTVEAVSDLFDPAIEGFGELFRMLSFDEIGSRAMLSRAAAGVVRGTPVFLLPGSPKAVALALTRLILPEIGHLVGELGRR
ncbi:MAG TPA: MogA/MoaB family molybdenum cofactor biosynthesis protein [Candidatus Polarisedimenticolaceae bacterium]|nr:MogA/MoaB family molybdenum cofactor biosynthesis protein [Candidatus Polarisedimenticolaceae bacterium]